MTKEEKAKAYDEAIKRAKPLMLDTNFSMKNTVISIFPELKESEDERIYNEIMEFFRMNEKRCIVDNSYTKWIAWLEKHKELPTNEEMLRTLRVEYEKGVADTIAKYEQKEQTEELSMRLNGVMQEYVKAGKDEEEQEYRLKCYQLFWDALGDSEFFKQKLSEPCDGICCGDDRFKIIGEARKDIIEKTNIAENEFSMELPLLDGILMRVWQVGWLNKKQEPAEWSKEDKDIIEGMIVDYKGEIEHLSDSTIDKQAKPVYQERIDFLNRLKTYCPKSYNDDVQNKIDDAIYLIKHYATHGHDKNLREKVINELKSLRTQPKQEWTIEDAKPGDILHTSSTASSKTFIFKGIRNDEHGSVECFCCYDSEDGFRKGEEELIGWKTDKYRLATPKQCIKLGRIMGKSGYIFHFETNKLQKLNKLYWKPSDEQMEALRVYLYHPQYINNSEDIKIKLVESLYNDLQKLL